MVKLSGVHSGTPVPYLEIAPGHRLAVMLSRCTGSSAYAINRRAAQAYLNGPQRCCRCSCPTTCLRSGLAFGLKVRL